MREREGGGEGSKIKSACTIVSSLMDWQEGKREGKKLRYIFRARETADLARARECFADAFLIWRDVNRTMRFARIPDQPWERKVHRDVRVCRFEMNETKKNPGFSRN